MRRLGRCDNLHWPLQYPNVLHTGVVLGICSPPLLVTGFPAVPFGAGMLAD